MAETGESGLLRLWRGKVPPEWLDYNGHMTEHRYLQVFGESSDALYDLLGVDFGNAQKGAFFTLATHIRHRAECKEGEALWTETDLLGHEPRFLHLFHRLFNAQGTLLAEGEHLSIHVSEGKTGPAEPAMQSRITSIFESQRGRAAPEGAGKVLSRPLENSRLG